MPVDVLYNPGFTHNLLYVARLVQDFVIKYVFCKSQCVFQKKNSYHLLGVDKMKGNLYVINSITGSYYCNFFNPRDMIVQEWHIFLGHPSITTMKHVKILGGKLFNKALQVVEMCEVYVKVKQTIGKFPVLHRRSNHMFDIVHVDL